MKKGQEIFGESAPRRRAETEISRPSERDSPVSKHLSRPDRNTCIRAETLLGI